MTDQRVAERGERRWGPWTAGQAVLRLLVLSGPVLALLAAGLEGDPPGRFLLVLTVAASVGFALAPDAHFGTVAFALVLVTWGVGPVDLVHPAVLLAAAALLVAHVAALLASAGPQELPLDRTVTLTWAVRGAVVFLAAPATWLLASALEGQPEPAGVWMAGVVAAIAAALVATAAFSLREGA